jgi:hypothetical protein
VIYRKLAGYQVFLALVFILSVAAAGWMLFISPARERVGNLEFLVGQQEQQIATARFNEENFADNTERLAQLMQGERSVFEVLAQIYAPSLQSSSVIAHDFADLRVYEIRVVAGYEGWGATAFLAELPPVRAFSVDFGGVPVARAELSIFGR